MQYLRPTLGRKILRYRRRRESFAIRMLGEYSMSRTTNL